MRYSSLFPKTRREVPKGVVAPGHQLLHRAGYVRSLGRGLFALLPLGVRVASRIEQIIRLELESLGGLEVSTPLITPIEQWKRSGRDILAATDMVTFRDRFGKELALSPTHEETMVELVQSGLVSYRDLPVFLFQFQEKYRDEERTRGGMVRAREFRMSDAYSFHRSFSDLNNFFPRVFRAYERIFRSCEVPCFAAEAGVGFMGGERSYEFLMPSSHGDDYLVECPKCGYVANRDVAVASYASGSGRPLPIERIETPDCTTMADLAGCVDAERSQLAKAMVFAGSTRLIMALVRADYDVSLEKLGRLVDDPAIRRATDAELRTAGVVASHAGPFHLHPDTLVVVDQSVVETPNLVCGSNESGIHFRNVNFGRDFDAHVSGDISRIRNSAPCRHCGATMKITRALELGHVFRLGDYYSTRMDLSIADERGRWFYPQMGSYGIGIGRLMAAIVDAHRDANGIIWPVSVAPFQSYLMTIGKSRSVRDAGDAIAEYLDHEVLYDDRDESIGTKFKDYLLLGIPFRIVVSQVTMSDGTVEVYDRIAASTHAVDVDTLPEFLSARQREYQDHAQETGHAL